MNEILFASPRYRWPRKGFFKRLLWNAAGPCALGGLFAWAFEDHWLRIERRDMPLVGLGKGFDGARLAHISDLHRSPIVLDRYLRRCVDLINAMEVDFVAITGDFIVSTRYYARRVARALGGLNPKVATVACLGNHDYGVFHPGRLGRARGLGDYTAQQLGHADIFVMMNERRVFRRGDSTIQFVGVEDYWTPRYNPNLAFDGIEHHLPTIALCHNPDAAAEMARCGADWVLAGHTHGTPVDKTPLFGMAIPSDCKHFYAGEYPLSAGGRLYVNRGLAYGRRINLNSRPEIALFTLRDAKPASPARN